MPRLMRQRQVVAVGAAAGARAHGAAPARVDGTDLILRHLHDGLDELISSLNAAEFSKTGKLLVYTVSASGRDDNGLFVESTRAGSVARWTTAAPTTRV